MVVSEEAFNLVSKLNIVSRYSSSTVVGIFCPTPRNLKSYQHGYYGSSGVENSTWSVYPDDNNGGCAAEAARR